jgi:hypothetical protein
MKHLFFVLIAFGNTIVFAQEKDYNHTQTGDAPSNVRGSFAKEYPQSSNTKWEQQGSQWHANYKDDNQRNADAYYDGSGNRLETVTSLEKKDIPASVDNEVNRRYKVNGNYYASRIERPNYGTFYKVKYSSKNKDHMVFMDEAGKKRHFHKKYSWDKS